ncbi:MAG: crossover junction endodeoxyribonuclease RuvC [Litorilinea sp.]
MPKARPAHAAAPGAPGAQSPPLESVAIGIDPGTASTGYGVVGMTVQGDFSLLACGVISTAADTPMHLRLLEIHRDISNLLDEFRPDSVAVEKLFFGRNVTTAISVGQARGAVLLAAAQKSIDVAEYTPAEVKQAIAGYGNAEKRQVQEMVQRLLDLPEVPRPDDAADGVAIAVCHLQRLVYHRRTGMAE